MSEDALGEQYDVAEDPLQEPWPEDMEQKRLDDLRQWASNYPQDPMVGMVMAQVNGIAWEGPSDDEDDSEDLGLPNKQRKTFERGYLNKWDLETTTELLDAMNKFQECLNAMDRRGVRVTTHSRWAVISKYVPNRHSLEQDKFAMSCRTHFANLCRVYKGQRRTAKDADLPADVMRGIRNYLRRCQHVRSSKKKQGMELDSILKMMDTVLVTGSISKRSQEATRKKPNLSFAFEVSSEDEADQEKRPYHDQMDHDTDSLRGMEECTELESGEVRKNCSRYPVGAGAAAATGATAEDRMKHSKAPPKRHENQSRRRADSRVLSKWKTGSGELSNSYRLQDEGGRDSSERYEHLVRRYKRLGERPDGGGRDSSERYEHLVRRYKKEMRERPVVSRDSSLAERASSQLADWFEYLETAPAPPPSNNLPPRVSSADKAVSYSKCSPIRKTVTKISRKGVRRKKLKYDPDFTVMEHKLVVDIGNSSDSGCQPASSLKDPGPGPAEKRRRQKIHPRKDTGEKRKRLEIPVDVVHSMDMSFKS